MTLDSSRPLRWRAATTVAGALVVAASWWAFGGTKHILQIDYEWVGELVEGAEVVVDGEVVGHLERLRRRHLNGFEVTKGEHVVEVRTPNCASRPDTVTVRPGRRVMLIADFEDRMSAGKLGCYVFFR